MAEWIKQTGGAFNAPPVSTYLEHELKLNFVPRPTINHISRVHKEK